MGNQIADDDVDLRHGSRKGAGGPGGTRHRCRRAQALRDLRRQEPADRDHADEAGTHLVELRLLPIPHEQRDGVAAGAQLERGIDHEPLGAADAQPRAQEGHVERSISCHEDPRNSLPSASGLSITFGSLGP